jgi:hypothetical protein
MLLSSSESIKNWSKKKQLQSMKSLLIQQSTNGSDHSSQLLTPEPAPDRAHKTICQKSLKKERGKLSPYPRGMLVLVGTSFWLRRVCCHGYSCRPPAQQAPLPVWSPIPCRSPWTSGRAGRGQPPRAPPGSALALVNAARPDSSMAAAAEAHGLDAARR